MNTEEDYEQTYEEYGRKVLDHFLNPRNVGKMDNPHVMVRVGDPSCGDHIELFMQIKNDTIEEISYLVHGCVGAISTSSALSELAKG
ncbi:MAG TPA: iron-sulfur cluster assembly scaffold protein, partial [Clostridia bacterium]|nr:iron-sulfur cluster assembly scaffold protein [Clostridia bacterium]